MFEVLWQRNALFAAAAISLFLLPVASSVFARDAVALAEMQPVGLDYAGIYKIRDIDPELTGLGVNIAVLCRSFTYLDGEPQNDYRPAVWHNCFENRNFIYHDTGQIPAGISEHSTAICSILFGEDDNAFNEHTGNLRYQGVVPEAGAEIFEFWHFLVNNVFTNSPPDCNVLTAGIGSQFENWWTRGMDSLAEKHGLIIVAGIGNGSQSYDPPLFPGAGANVIGVGVVDSVNSKQMQTSLAYFALAYPEHSSFGPTSDGRCKPDIVAPGNCLAADVNDAAGYKATGNWSSFSTPLVAGTAGLLVQKAKQDPNLKAAIDSKQGNCLMKAVLMNSADKLAFWHKGKLTKDDDHIVPLDYIQGAGMLNALGAYQNFISGQFEAGNVPKIGWDLNRLDKKEDAENIYKIELVGSKDGFITATVVWNKHFNNKYPFDSIPEKDYNLRLELWAVDNNNPDNDYLLDYSDSNVDNIEHIYCRLDANYSDYEIVVSNSGMEKPDESIIQSYALAWNVGDGSEKPQADSIFWYDLNADGIVDKHDFTILAEKVINEKKMPESSLIGDINTDGAIDVNDLGILIKHFNDYAQWYTD